MSFKRYPSYKDSGVEWLAEMPEHWAIRRVRWLCEIKKRIAGELGHDVLSITQQGIKVKDLDSNDGQLSMDYSKYQFVEIGDFAMNHMDLLTGYVDLSPVHGVTSPDYRVFTIREPAVCHDKYLLYLFQMGYKNKIFFAYGQGSSQLGRWRLPTEQFNDLPFPLPPKTEQQNIAALLDRETAKIDELVAEQQRLMELLQEKRQAVISHAVTKGLIPDAPLKPSGIDWLGDVPAHWEVVPLKHLCNLLKDGTHLPPERVDDGIPLLSVRNLVGGEFVLREDDSMISEESYQDLSRAFVPKAGDVLLAIVGATIGKTAVVSSGIGPFHIQRSVAIFRTKADVLHAGFLNLVFQSSSFQALLWELVGYSAQPGIYLGTLQNIRVTVPPLDEQTMILESVSSVATELTALATEAQRAIDLLQERRTALISAAVTGQIDVRELNERKVA